MPKEIIRMLPANLEAERAILGAILLEGSVLFTAAQEIASEDLYLEAHRVIFSAMQALSERESAIDGTLLIAELHRQGKLEAAGGHAYVMSLTDGLPRAVNIKHYAELVREASIRRRLIQAANQTMAMAYQGEENAADILERHEAEISKIAAGAVKSGFRTADEVVTAAYREIEQASNRRSVLSGLPTGFTALDHMTGGLMPSDLVIVAARPGLGKTSLCLNIADHVATKHGKHVAIFSLEMGAVQLAKMRMLAAEAEVDSHKLRTGFLNKEEWARVGRAAGILAQAKIWIDDSNSTMVQIRAKANRLAMEEGLDLVVIDYMQLMAGYDGRMRENRTQEVTAISRGCKQLAKELSVPVIAVSQLNRALEHGGKNRRPQLSDLRESGAIEQDADLVIFIHREEANRPSEDNAGIAELIIGKQRNGPTGDIQLAFIKQFTKFADLYQETEQRNLYPAG